MKSGGVCFAFCFLLGAVAVSGRSLDSLEDGDVMRLLAELVNREVYDEVYEVYEARGTSEDDAGSGTEAPVVGTDPPIADNGSGSGDDGSGSGGDAGEVTDASATDAPIIDNGSGSGDEDADAEEGSATSAPSEESTQGSAVSDEDLAELAAKWDNLIASLENSALNNPFYTKGGLETIKDMKNFWKSVYGLPSDLHKTFTTDKKIDGGDLKGKTRIDFNRKKNGEVLSIQSSNTFQKGDKKGDQMEDKKGDQMEDWLKSYLNDIFE